MTNQPPMRRQYGMAPHQSVRKTDLPQNMVFWRHDSGEIYPLNANGVSQFLRKCQLPVSPQNIEWAIDALLTTPIDETANLNGIDIGLSCEMEYDPGNVTLSDMGIAKSMVYRRVPETYNDNIQVQDSRGYIPPSYGNANLLAGKIPMGEGVDFGKPTLTVFNDRVMKYRRNDQGAIGGLK